MKDTIIIKKEKKEIGTKEKIELFKKLTITLMILLVVVSITLAFNLGEVRKYKSIESDNYITVNECDALVNKLAYDLLPKDPSTTPIDLEIFNELS